MMKKEFPLKVCPWCWVTPNFEMYVPLEKSWCPTIMCKNPDCVVQPAVKTVAIRKKQRANAVIIEQKITRVVDRWNTVNAGFANEGFEIDFEKIAVNFILRIRKGRE